jgi:hypothetical protein
MLSLENSIQPQMKNIIITQLLYNIKKNSINLFSLYNMKKNKRKEKRFKEEKKIGNTLKGKNLKAMKLVVGVLGAAMLCAIHSATIKSTLF